MPSARPLVLAAVGCAVWLGASGASFAQEEPKRPRDLLNDFFNDESDRVEPQRVVRFALRGTQLAVASDMTPEDGVRHVRLKGLDGRTRVQVGRRARGPFGVIPFFELNHRGPAGPDGGGTLHLAVLAQSGSLRITRTTQRGGLHTSVTLTQDGFVPPGRVPRQRGDRVTLRVRVIRNALKPDVDLRLTAASFADLLSKHAGPAATHLAPVFRDLGGQDPAVFGVDPCVAWQLFPDAVEPGEALASKVIALVERLDADDFLRREAAATELEALGGPATLVLAELDRAALSAEQNTRIDAFLADYRQLEPAEAAALLEDPEFLLRCYTYSEAEPIRAAAVRALEALLGRPAKLEPGVDFGARLVAAATLREEMAKEKSEEGPGA